MIISGAKIRNKSEKLISFSIFYFFMRIKRCSNMACVEKGGSKNRETLPLFDKTMAAFAIFIYPMDR